MNQWPRAPKANTITTEIKKILPNIEIVEAALLEGVVSRNTPPLYQGSSRSQTSPQQSMLPISVYWIERNNR